MTDQKAIEDLEFIKNIMQDAKKKMVDNGISMIVWGLIIVTGLLSTYVGIKVNYQFSYGWNWIVVIGSGWIYSFIQVYKNKKQPKNRNFAGRVLGHVWFSSGIAMTILGFVGSLSGAYHGVFISPLVSTILGLAYFITGFVLGKPWVTKLSAGWWTGAIIMFLWPYLYTLLLMASMIICFQIIPGIIFNRESKKLKLSENEGI
ncbi:MAG: hypothetical protein PF445_06955 [Melioribacteraceae bacterium]|nr:hypothetical protein [Melioribacteraceae bacterium]